MAPELTEAEVRRAIDGHFGLRLKDDGWICCGCLAVVAPESAEMQDAREGLYAHRAGKVWSLFEGATTRQFARAFDTADGMHVDDQGGAFASREHAAQDTKEGRAESSYEYVSPASSPTGRRNPVAELTKDAIDTVLAEHVEEVDADGYSAGRCTCRFAWPAPVDAADRPFKDHLRDVLWKLVEDSTCLEWAVRTRTGNIVEADTEEWARSKPDSSPYYAGATVVANRMTGWEDAAHG